MIAMCVSFQTWAVKKKGPVLVSMFSPIQTVCSIIFSTVFLDQIIKIGRYYFEKQNKIWNLIFSTYLTFIHSNDNYIVCKILFLKKNKLNKGLIFDIDHTLSHYNLSFCRQTFILFSIPTNSLFWIYNYYIEK